jgi:hypothetical protein
LDTQIAETNSGAPIKINCPSCNTRLAWPDERVCPNGHAVGDVAGIPLCFRPETMEWRKTADPLYPIAHAIGVANDIAQSAGTFRGALDRFFEIRERELDTDLSREKALITRRVVPAVNECIADASYFLAKMNKPFPSPQRYHIDVGCGMGFGLAASSKSYFGTNVIGLDLSPHYLIMARLQLKEHGVEKAGLACADICEGLPVPLDEYDVAFISMEGVLEHIKDVPAYFNNIQKIKSFPFAVYLTVPYRWTVNLESHFNMRWITWVPRAYQDRYIAERLGVPEIDHVEFYSRSSLRRTLERYFKPEAVAVEANSDHPFKTHFLRALIYVEGPQSFA